MSFNTVKMLILPKLIYIVNAIQIESLTRFQRMWRVKSKIHRNVDSVIRLPNFQILAWKLLETLGVTYSKFHCFPHHSSLLLQSNIIIIIIPTFLLGGTSLAPRKILRDNLIYLFTDWFTDEHLILYGQWNKSGNQGLKARNILTDKNIVLAKLIALCFSFLN